MNDITARQLWITATRIRSDTEILTWSRDNGYGIIPFRIYDTTPRTVIKIYSATIKKPRPDQPEGIPEGHFAMATPIAMVRRAARCLPELSQNTSYMFGILKWMEDQNE